jgi:hypothetical protein
MAVWVDFSVPAGEFRSISRVIPGWVAARLKARRAPVRHVVPFDNDFPAIFPTPAHR